MQDLIKALVKAQQGFTAIKKDRTNPHYKNRYATLDSVLSAVNPALHENGLAVIQTTDVMGEKFVLVTRLLHESGQELMSTYVLPDIQDPQKLGSAVTYARRYSLCALLNVTADEDDDGEAAKPVGNKPTAVPSAAKPASPDIITKPQRDRLFAIADQHGVTKEEASEVLTRFGYSSSKDVRKADYEAIIEAFKAVHQDVAFAG